MKFDVDDKNRCRLVRVKFHLNRCRFAGAVAKCLGGSLFWGHSVSIYLFNMVTEQRLRFFAHMKMKTIAMQLLVRFASIHQTGNDLQEVKKSKKRGI